MSGQAFPSIPPPGKGLSQPLAAVTRLRRLQAVRAGYGWPAVRFDQPRGCHWAQHEQVVCGCREKIAALGLVVSCLAFGCLGWRELQGEAVPVTRWLLGAASGWFVIAMLRMGLFVLQAAPRWLVVESGGVLRLSGLGKVRAREVLGWSMKRRGKRRHRKAAVEFSIRCRWLEWERTWSLWLEDDWQAARLLHLLRALCPEAEVRDASRASPRSLRREVLPLPTLLGSEAWN